MGQPGKKGRYTVDISESTAEILHRKYGLTRRDIRCILKILVDRQIGKMEADLGLEDPPLGYASIQVMIAAALPKNANELTLLLAELWRWRAIKSKNGTRQ